MEARSPTMEVVKDIASLPNWEFPVLERIIECPVFDASGSLVDQPGYHANSTLWYHQTINIAPVSMQPTDDEIKRARNLIEFELLGDFPFKEQSPAAQGA